MWRKWNKTMIDLEKEKKKSQTMRKKKQDEETKRQDRRARGFFSGNKLINNPEITISWRLHYTGCSGSGRKTH